MKYAHPVNVPPELWLELEGRLLDSCNSLKEGEIRVCLVDRGKFRVIKVPTLQADFGDLDRELDPKRWFAIPREKLVEIGALSQ